METLIWVFCIAIATCYFVYHFLSREIAPMVSRREEQMAIRRFSFQREHLEARFTEMAIQQNTPHAFECIECDWKSEVGFARDRVTGGISALVSLDIVLTPSHSDLDSMAETYRKSAVALFHYQNGAWETRGVALFNQTPAAAVEERPHHYQEILAA